MAVKFLDNLNLVGNQLLNTKLQVLAGNPTGVAILGEGQIFFDSSAGVKAFKYYNGTDWIDPSDGDYTGWTLTGDSGTSASVTDGAAVVFVGGTGITTTSNGFNLSIDLDEATATTRGGIELFSNTDQSVTANAVSATASRTYGLQLNSAGQGVVNVPWADGVDGSGSINTLAMFTASDTIGDSIYTQNGGATEAKITGGFFATGYLKDSGGDLGTAGQLLSSTGTLTNWIDAPVSYTKWVAQDVAAPVNDGDLYFLEEDSANPGVRPGTTTKSGTTITQKLSLSVKSMTSASPSDFATDSLLWSDDDVASSWKVQKSHIEDIPVSAWGDATSTVGMNSQKIIDLADPTVAQDAATKAYVDSAVTGGLNVKGGFNASTGIVALTSVSLYTATAVAVGDYYIVTTAGDFFGQASTPLTVGDSVLCQTASASPASITDFAVIQSDTDLATLTTVGIGNVNPATLKPLQGIAVDYPVATPGTALLGLDIKNMDPFAGGSDVLGKSDQVAVYDASAGWNKRTTVLDIGAIGNSNNSEVYTSASGTTHTFTHNLNTRNVSVQLFDTSTFDTVYATVVRTSASVVTVTTAATADITCLITKVG